VDMASPIVSVAVPVESGAGTGGLLAGVSTTPATFVTSQAPVQVITQSSEPQSVATPDVTLTPSAQTLSPPKVITPPPLRVSKLPSIQQWLPD